MRRLSSPASSSSLQHESMASQSSRGREWTAICRRVATSEPGGPWSRTPQETSQAPMAAGMPNALEPGHPPRTRRSAAASPGAASVNQSRAVQSHLILASVRRGPSEASASRTAQVNLMSEVLLRPGRQRRDLLTTRRSLALCERASPVSAFVGPDWRPSAGLSRGRHPRPRPTARYQADAAS